jgi:hypothetical protein
VLAETRREDVRRRIEQAKARGDRWVELEGSRPFLEMPFPPWQSIQMRLPDGTAIHSWVEESLNETGDGFEFGVEVIALDPQTGTLLGSSRAAGRQTFNDYQAWQQEIESLKAR